MFDGTTDQGKMFLSVAMLAFSAQKPVNIAGYNDQCGAWGVENLYHLSILN